RPWVFRVTRPTARKRSSSMMTREGAPPATWASSRPVNSFSGKSAKVRSTLTPVFPPMRSSRGARARTNGQRLDRLYVFSIVNTCSLLRSFQLPRRALHDLAQRGVHVDRAAEVVDGRAQRHRDDDLVEERRGVRADDVAP